MNWDFYVDDTDNMETIRLGFKNGSDTITDVSIMSQTDIDTIKDNAVTAVSTANKALSTAQSADGKVDSAKSIAESAYTQAKTNTTNINSLFTSKANKSDVETALNTLQNTVTTVTNTLNNTILIEPIRYATVGGGDVDFKTVKMNGDYVGLTGTFTATCVDGDSEATLTFTKDTSNPSRWSRKNFLPNIHGKSVEIHVKSFTPTGSSTNYNIKPKTWIIHVY